MIYGQKGTLDFIQYWSAFQLLISGQNPYDIQSMRLLQESLGNDSLTIMMWAPPWTAVLLAPVLLLPFSSSAQFWFITNVFLFFFSAVLLSKRFSKNDRANTYGILSAVFFYPIYENLLWGQISVFLLFFLSLFFFLITTPESKRGKYHDYWIGISLIPLTTKPHLLYLLYLSVFIWVFRTKRWNVLVASLGSLSLLIIITVAISPHSITYWLQSLFSTPSDSNIPSVMQWKSAAFSSSLRELLTRHQSTPPIWPMWFLPLAACGALAFYYMKKDFTWQHHLPTILCISLITTPYGWLYDYSLLLVIQCAVVCYSLQLHVSKQTRLLLVGSLVLIQLAILTLSIQPWSNQASYFWLPLAMLGVYLIAEYLFIPIANEKSRLSR